MFHVNLTLFLVKVGEKTFISSDNHMVQDYMRLNTHYTPTYNLQIKLDSSHATS